MQQDPSGDMREYTRGDTRAGMCVDMHARVHVDMHAGTQVDMHAGLTSPEATAMHPGQFTSRYVAEG